jgi:N-acetyl-1-D-myo-inositol-2-amino-2-deoxy-alpha-D-glucopyranoside deacetylase
VSATDLPERRVLFVHAHPDDETVSTGATMARYAASGAHVTLITCTLGEEGEVHVPAIAGLAAAEADQLGGYRYIELERACAALGVTDHRYLGGAGRYRDSGMMGTESNKHPRAFWGVDVDEAAALLVEVIREVRPQVVVTYDANGGYGHPDHIRAHEVTTAAVAAAGGDSHPGEPWEVPKFYWTVMAESGIADGLADIGDPPADWIQIKPSDITFGYPDEKVDAVIDAVAHLPAKAAALRAHATQVSVAADGRSLALSNLVALPLWGIEHYVLVKGAAGERDERGVETDLLAGLKLG